MSFWIWVVRAEDLERSNAEGKRLLYAEFSSEDERRVALEKWQDESDKRHLFSAHLGGDSAVGRYWSGMASKLELPMLASLYEHGLVLETAGQMEMLERELDVLEAYWGTHSDELHDEPGSGIFGEEKEYLREGMEHVREGIRIAKESGAMLGMS